MRKIDGKKGAINLSIGTLVIIILAITMLVLGVILVTNIFDIGEDLASMTKDQIIHKMNTLFGEEEELMLLPSSKEIEVEVGEEGTFAVGIRNLLKGQESTTKKFTYNIGIAEQGNCPMSERELENLIVTGRELSAIELSPGSEPLIRTVRMRIPEGTPLCSFSYKIEVYHHSTIYDTDFMHVSIT